MSGGRNKHLELYRQELGALLDSEHVNEEQVHQFLTRTPILLPLIWPLYNRVFSKLRLGNQHVTDFAFARLTTCGVQWYFIELEHPRHPLFNRSGDPSAKLSHGLRQINDWESWFRQHINYVEHTLPFQKSMRESGLYTDVELMLVIGRRELLTDDQRQRLRTMVKPNQSIMTYDRLVDESGAGCFPQFTVDCCSFAGGTTETLGSVVPAPGAVPCFEER